MFYIKNQNDNMEKKQKVEQAFGLRWFKEQQPALSQCTEDSILLKDDMYKFACHPDRQEFVEEWCSPHDVMPIYEVITDGYARLHFDIESEFPGNAPPAEELKQWLQLCIDAIKSSLEEVGVEQKDRDTFMVSSDCRHGTHGFKRSYHLVWPNVFFQK
jgi:hypothetical protein